MLDRFDHRFQFGFGGLFGLAQVFRAHHATAFHLDPRFILGTRHVGRYEDRDLRVEPDAHLVHAEHLDYRPEVDLPARHGDAIGGDRV